MGNQTTLYSDKDFTLDTKTKYDSNMRQNLT